MTDEQKQLLLLQCLRNAGVDNWDGWDFAIEEYNNRLEELGETE